MKSTICWSSAIAVAAVLAVSVVSGRATDDWPTVTGAAGNMRYSPLTQITTQNVTKLGAAWTSEKLDAAASSRAMPVVKDGLMFFTAPPFVYALGNRGARLLIERLAQALPFYLRFYRADNQTGSKSAAPLEWFEKLSASRP